MKPPRRDEGRLRPPGGSPGSVFVISAPSGAGKTTLCKRLLDEDRAIEFSVSFTTRPPRAGERNDVDYLLVFILPPGRAALRDRLEKRGTDGPHEVARRLSLARGEVEKCLVYDFVIINDDLETAYRQLQAVLEATRCRSARQMRRIEGIVREFASEL